MVFRYIVHLTRSKNILFLILVSSLTACSGGDGGLSSDVESSSEGEPSSGVELRWTAPEQREDGAALGLSAIAGYRIYYGVEPGAYSNQIDINDHTVTEYQWSGVLSGNYFVVMTTVDTVGRESAKSAPEIEINL